MVKPSSVNVGSDWELYACNFIVNGGIGKHECWQAVGSFMHVTLWSMLELGNVHNAKNENREWWRKREAQQWWKTKTWTTWWKWEKMNNGINGKHKLQWKWESKSNSRNGKCKNQNWKMVVAMDLKQVMYILGSLQS